jgi:hypothetical protein
LAHPVSKIYEETFFCFSGCYDIVPYYDIRQS